MAGDRTLFDLLGAIRWMHAHAEELRVDPDRIYLIGQAAGGHMVSLFATAGEGGHPRVGGWEKTRPDVRAVISVAAAYESQYAVVGQPLDTGERQPGGSAPARLAGRAVTATTKPLLIIHSDDDKSVPVQQAIDMMEKLKAVGVHHRFVHFTSHGITDEVVKEARSFIAEIEQKK